MSFNLDKKTTNEKYKLMALSSNSATVVISVGHKSDMTPKDTFYFKCKKYLC